MPEGKRKKFTYNVNFTGERKLQYLYKYNKCVDLASETDCPHVRCVVAYGTLLQAGKYYPAFSSFHFFIFAENSAPGDHTKENDGSRNNDDKQKHPHISGGRSIFTLDDMVSAL